MIEILNFENFSKNELFGFGKKYEFDSKAIEVFQDLLENIDKIEVQKFADYRREVTLTKKKEEKDSSIESSGEVKEARIMRVPKSQTKITKVGEVESKNKQNTQIDDTDVAVLKNYSKHRKSSKIWGSFKENSYSLVINGKPFAIAFSSILTYPVEMDIFLIGKTLFICTLSLKSFVHTFIASILEAFSGIVNT